MLQGFRKETLQPGSWHVSHDFSICFPGFSHSFLYVSHDFVYVSQDFLMKNRPFFVGQLALRRFAEQLQLFGVLQRFDPGGTGFQPRHLRRKRVK